VRTTRVYSAGLAVSCFAVAAGYLLAAACALLGDATPARLAAVASVTGVVSPMLFVGVAFAVWLLVDPAPGSSQLALAAAAALAALVTPWWLLAALRSMPITALIVPIYFVFAFLLLASRMLSLVAWILLGIGLTRASLVPKWVALSAMGGQVLVLATLPLTGPQPSVSSVIAMVGLLLQVLLLVVLGVQILRPRTRAVEPALPADSGSR
jgi:hypothetical protein